MKIKLPFIRTSEMPENPPMGQTGSSGMVFGSMGRLNQQEYLYDLVGENGYKTYERMRRSDPKIVGLRRAIDLPVLRATWDVTPKADDKGNVSDRAKEIAEFVEKNLFEEMDKGWPDQLAEILRYQDLGFAAFEKIWAVEDGKVKLKKLGYLPPRTVLNIYVIHRELDHIDQVTPDQGMVEIPGRKMLWFVHAKEGDNFRGVPILRAMYRPWFNKERAEILLLVMAERMGGWLKFVAPDGATKSDIDTAKHIGQEFRINETMYMVLPPHWDATVESSTGMTLSDLQNFIRYCDEQIESSALAQVLGLGTSMEGSRALGRTLGEIFDESVQATADYVCDTFNLLGGLIQELCAYNFPDWEENLPTLTVGKVEKIDVKSFGLGFQALVAGGLRFGEKTHAWIREECGFPDEPELDKVAEKLALDPSILGTKEKDQSPPTQSPFDNSPGAKKGDSMGNVKKGPYVPPGEGDYNPPTGDVPEQPEG